MIIINIKNYKVGKEVLELVRTIDIYCNKAIVAVPPLEIKTVVKETSVPVYAQHVDYQEKGKSTGYLVPEAILEAGATGSLLNHFEHRMIFAKLKKTVERCKEVGLKTIVCAANLTEVKKISKLKPYALAFEDPKLIASGRSITEEKANEIKEFVKLLENTEIISLCGAGITTGKDVAEAIILGCKGVLVSSIVASSQQPEKFLKEVSEII